MQSKCRKIQSEFTIGFYVRGINCTDWYARMVGGETCCTTRRTIGSEFHNGFAKDVNEGLSKILGGHFETFFERVKNI